MHKRWCFRFDNTKRKRYIALKVLPGISCIVHNSMESRHKNKALIISCTHAFLTCDWSMVMSSVYTFGTKWHLSITFDESKKAQNVVSSIFPYFKFATSIALEINIILSYKRILVVVKKLYRMLYHGWKITTTTTLSCVTRLMSRCLRASHVNSGEGEKKKLSTPGAPHNVQPNFSHGWSWGYKQFPLPLPTPNQGFGLDSCCTINPGGGKWGGGNNFSICFESSLATKLGTQMYRNYFGQVL